MSVLWSNPQQNSKKGQNINKQSSLSSIIAFSQLPSSLIFELQVQEISIVPRRISFSKRRGIIQQQTYSGQENKARLRQLEKQRQGINESNVSATSSIRSKRERPAQPLQDLPLLKNKLLTSKIQALQSGIDLSIISEGKSESKLVTPQQNKAKAEAQRKSSQNKRKTTFQQWFENKHPRRQDQFTFSMNQIGEMTINPALNSFYEEPITSQTIKQQRSLSFKDFLNKKEQPLLNDRGVNLEETRSKRLVKLRSLSKDRSKNDIAKRIIQIQNLLAMKGAALPAKAKIITLATQMKHNPKQKAPTQPLEQQNKVLFEMSFSSSQEMH